MNSLSFLVFAFTAVFTIVNPITAVTTFVTLTSGMSPETKRNIANRSVFMACLLAIAFSITGELILKLFDITVNSLRVAGGFLLFLVALDMLHARASRESVTKEEISEAARKEDIAIFPLAMPMLTGPGAITTVIVLMGSADNFESKILVLIAILITFIISYFIFRFADYTEKLLGVTGMLVLTRLMGLFLGAIAVNFITDGVWEIYKDLSKLG